MQSRALRLRFLINQGRPHQRRKHPSHRHSSCSFHAKCWSSSDSTLLVKRGAAKRSVEPNMKARLRQVAPMESRAVGKPLLRRVGVGDRNKRKGTQMTVASHTGSIPHSSRTENVMTTMIKINLTRPVVAAKPVRDYPAEKLGQRHVSKVLVPQRSQSAHLLAELLVRSRFHMQAQSPLLARNPWMKEPVLWVSSLSQCRRADSYRRGPVLHRPSLLPKTPPNICCPRTRTLPQSRICSSCPLYLCGKEAFSFHVITKEEPRRESSDGMVNQKHRHSELSHIGKKEHRGKVGHRSTMLYRRPWPRHRSQELPQSRQRESGFDQSRSHRPGKLHIASHQLCLSVRTGANQQSPTRMWEIWWWSRQSTAATVRSTGSRSTALEYQAVTQQCELTPWSNEGLSPRLLLDHPKDNSVILWYRVGTEERTNHAGRTSSICAGPAFTPLSLPYLSLAPLSSFVP